MKKDGKEYENRGRDYFFTRADGRMYWRTIWRCIEDKKEYVKWGGNFIEVVRGRHGYVTVGDYGDYV